MNLESMGWAWRLGGGQTAEAGKRQGAKSQSSAWRPRKLGKKILVCEGNRRRLSPGPEEKLKATFPKANTYCKTFCGKSPLRSVSLGDTID